MKVVLLALIVFCAVTFTEAAFGFRNKEYGMVPPPSDDGLLRELEPKWFENLVDHMDNTNLATWKQKYYINEEFMRPISKPHFPIFLYIGSEGALSSKWLTQGLMYNYANATGALMFALEHRFYGSSQPRGDHSSQNLAYLSSQQALADLAYFIKAMGYSDHPWVVFGGSYGGSLAAWARQRYPSLIHAAIASSAPLEPKIDFTEYVEVMEYAFKYYGGSQCVSTMASARDRLIELLETVDGAKILTDRLKLCVPITAKQYLNNLDYLNFWATLSDTIATVVQYNKEGGERNGLLTVNELCKSLTTASEDPLEGYFAMFDRILKNSGDQCLSWTYKSMIEGMSDTAIDVRSNMRQWMWQTCTEFGFYQTTRKSIFTAPFDVSLFGSMCSDVYGPAFTLQSLTANARRTNSSYGSTEYRQTNTFFTNGDIDPWHALSINQDRKRPVRINAWLTSGTSHCAILYADQPYDVPALTDARQQVFRQLVDIIEDFYQNH